jgi:hypothetical protein
MGALHALRNGNMTAAAAIAAGAVLVAGCGTRDLSDTRAQVTPATAAAPMSVACEPGQRAIVRPVVINGANASQVECTSVAGAPAMVTYQAAPGAVPVSYGAPVAYATPAALDNARAVPATYPVRTVESRRTLARRTPVYERSRRSVATSALIIGSSAGAGAGIGAAVGGKKGALVGALLGGSGATLWDQITRRK